jgi:uncharacterized protein YndB with AHSA1/START domain
MVMWIVAIVVLVIALILVVAAMKPNTFSVAREGQINAPPEKIFALINDFHEWTKWSPWEKMDPNLTRNHSGITAGKGAVYDWSGNRQVGQGQMTITESAASSRIDIDLHFMKPFEARNKTVFSLTIRRYQSALGNDRLEPLHVQGNGLVHRHGQDDRQGFRGGAGEYEGGGGGLGRICRVHVFLDFFSVIAFRDGNVILALKFEPELRRVSEVTRQTQSGICGNGTAAI